MIYLSNPTRQNWVFHYRTPKNLLASCEIHSGQQEAIGRDWSPEETEGVVAQMRLHGFREATEFYGKVGKFLALVYSLKDPTQTDEILVAHEAVEDTQRQRSVDEAVKAAAAFDLNANKGGGKRQRFARATQTEVIEQIPQHQRPTGNEVAFSLTVDQDAATSNLKMPA